MCERPLPPDTKQALRSSLISFPLSSGFTSRLIGRAATSEYSHVAPLGRADCLQPTRRGFWTAAIRLLVVALVVFCLWSLAKNSFGQQPQQPPAVYQWQGRVNVYQEVQPQPAWYYPPAPRRGPMLLGFWPMPITRAVLGIPPYRQQRGMVIVPQQQQPQGAYQP